MLAKPRSITYRIIITCILAMGLVAGFFGLQQRIIQDQNRYTYRAGSSQLVLTASGQLWNAHFQHPLQKVLYHYNGSETPKRRFVTWSRGLLSIGVNQVGLHGFKGLFAVTEPSFPAGSFVETSMKPLRAAPKPGQYAETIVAVQTATTPENGQINYVIASLTQAPRGNLLQLGYANGVVRDAKTYILRDYQAPHLFTTVANQPVTISTNGLHDLKIWLGSRLILNESRLDLNIIPPFQVYLEVQSQGLRYAARFHRLVIYRSNQVTMDGIPNGAIVTVLGPHGTPLAEGPARHGTFTMTLTPPRLQASVTVRVSLGTRVTTFHGVVVKGGDVYAYRA